MTLNLNGHSVDIFGNHIFYFKYWVYILIYSRPWAIPSLTLTQYWTEFRYPLSYLLSLIFKPSAAPFTAFNITTAVFTALSASSAELFTSSSSSFVTTTTCSSSSLVLSPSKRMNSLHWSHPPAGCSQT